MKLRGNILMSFVAVLLVQIMLSGLVDFGPLVFIAIYPLFIFTLPINTPVNGLLLWAFAMGLAVDYFTNSIMGLNSSASLVMALLQPQIFKAVSRKGDLENQIRPGLAQLGYAKFALYALILLTIHHIFFSMAESLGFTHFIYNLPRLFVSIAANTLLIILVEYSLFYKLMR
ncbi:MAG: hypothetical protein Q8S23_00100 [Bacteroidales bacterium]|jgi:hypothetical protein|nr:hypothetical protein [Bacteroidales bacterium]